jgi:transcriptional regulator with XRE-family HTH domain
MGLGARISAARKSAGMTQAQLAELLDVSTEAVSKWEQDKYVPSADKLQRLNERLNLCIYEDDGTVRDMRVFDETHMSAFLRGKLASGSFPEASKALSFAKAELEGHILKPEAAGIPYINHPLTMACHALALGLNDDVLLAALLLHDVPEVCGIAPKDLPVCEAVRSVIALLQISGCNQMPEQYYAGILTDPTACLVKCMDWCSFLSAASFALPSELLESEIREIETWYPQLLKRIKAQPVYNNAAWLLKYQLAGLLECEKQLLRNLL